MPQKPIKQGYKIFGLGEQGYLWTFSMSNDNLRISTMFRTPGLTKTGSLVVELIEQLPVFLQSTEQQSTEQQSTEQQSINQQSTEQQSTEQQSINQQSTEQQSTEQQSTEQQSINQQSINQQSTEQQSTEQQSTEQQSINQQSTEQQSTEQQSTEQHMELNNSKEVAGYSIYMDNYFTSVALFHYL
ncbi:hypothetical protein I7I50_06534 [Histoplasma capsulatum G186AR]|uniref:PiggyBac transposable element-derived protein domain-containing protein n=1 Tax=Ajellomyces capsulatus TaxID=5037 RepID=A0A8H7Z2H8_AJECA|nr:hypothetical protein I7I52_10394 [Histoplasma capsulatum]QSS67447.1 hypothetical protein I7I50_06534 [Histoplasma capsulatum G186AR]